MLVGSRARKHSHRKRARIRKPENRKPEPLKSSWELKKLVYCVHSNFLRHPRLTTVPLVQPADQLRLLRQVTVYGVSVAQGRKQVGPRWVTAITATASAATVPSLTAPGLRVRNGLNVCGERGSFWKNDLFPNCSHSFKFPRISGTIRSTSDSGTVAWLPQSHPTYVTASNDNGQQAGLVPTEPGAHSLLSGTPLSPPDLQFFYFQSLQELLLALAPNIILSCSFLGLGTFGLKRSIIWSVAKLLQWISLLGSSFKVYFNFQRPLSGERDSKNPKLSYCIPALKLFILRINLLQWNFRSCGNGVKEPSCSWA